MSNLTPRNNKFYKLESDIVMNTEIEKNFERMFQKLNPNDYGFNDGNVIRDGIYPNYTKQKCKVLFIGRDSHGLAGYDYSWTTWGNLTDPKIRKRGGYKAFDRNMMTIGYCLSNENYDVEKYPARNIYRYVKDDNGHNNFSFAFINISKISNKPSNSPDKDEYECNKSNISTFVHSVGKDLIKEEIDIINPDIIIGLNLQGLQLSINTDVLDLERVKATDYSTCSFDIFKYNNNKTGKEIPFIDSKKHFSVMFKVDETKEFIESWVEFKTKYYEDFFRK